MVEERDIVCVSTTDWDEVWGSRQQIASTLARRYRVIYVERQVGPEHLARYPNLRGRWRRGDVSERAGVTLLRPPLLGPGRFFSRLVDDFSQHRLASWLRGHLARLGVTRPILWLYPPNSHLLPRLLPNAVSLYHCIDRFAGQSTGRKARVLRAEEADTLKAVDACLAYSRAIAVDHSRIQPRTVYWPNGCDFSRIRSLFAVAGPEPEDLARIPHPRLGHMGSVAGKTDLGLVDRLSRERPEWQLVFVGNEYPHDLDMERWTMMKARPNVHFLGPKPIADVPLYEKGFDLCLVLWQVNAWTRELQPIKIFEYLATGRPIVSMRLPELVDLAAAIRFADSTDDFLAACSSALEARESVAESGQLALAETYSWENRLKEAVTKLRALGLEI